MYKILLSLSFLLAAFSATAQTPGDYFHRGAQFYIGGQKQKATNEVYTGLRLFPSDPQLNGLAGLLKKEEEKNQQNQQQQQDQRSDQSKQDKNQQGQSQQSQSEQKQPDASQQKDQQEQQQQAKQDQQQQQAAKQSQDQKQSQSQTGQASGPQQDKSDDKDEKAYAAGQMTPEQARQLLDSEKGDEKMLPFKPEGKLNDRTKPVRDW